MSHRTTTDRLVLLHKALVALSVARAQVQISNRQLTTLPRTSAEHDIADRLRNADQCIARCASLLREIEVQLNDS